MAFSSGVHAGKPNPPHFSVDQGRVRVGSRSFENLGEYFRSDYFRESGRRCLVKAAPPEARGAIVFRANAADCSSSETVIQPEYWPAETYIVPIVFHIIHKTDGTGDISDQRVLDQVQVLNEDFRALTGSMGEFGYDTKIQFELQEITRTANDDWHLDRDEAGYKSALGWDQSRYLNVYVNTAGGYLGYAYLPQTSAGSVYDGVVLLYEAVGGRYMGYEPYDQGRTLVHEIGHYFGLLHTFEDGCGDGYHAGDLVADTNAEAYAHFGCDQTDTCDSLDEIHNYMNYTDDICMSEFTPEQANRTVCGLLNYRPQLYRIESAPPAQVLCVDRSGANPSCYQSISAALQAATEPTEIRVTADAYLEEVEYLGAVEILITGGWNGNFTDQMDFSEVRGSLTITGGTVSVSNLVINGTADFRKMPPPTSPRIILID